MNFTNFSRVSWWFWFFIASNSQHWLPEKYAICGFKPIKENVCVHDFYKFWLKVGYPILAGFGSLKEKKKSSDMFAFRTIYFSPAAYRSIIELSWTRVELTMASLSPTVWMKLCTPLINSTSGASAKPSSIFSTRGTSPKKYWFQLMCCQCTYSRMNYSKKKESFLEGTEHFEHWSIFSLAHVGNRLVTSE